MELKGKVISGLGNASFWVEKASKVFEKKYGMKLFLGTLNVELEEPYKLNSEEKILPDEYGGEYVVLVKKVLLFENEVYILRPEINNAEGGHHPLNIIEVVSDINLREKYYLQDGDEVSIIESDINCKNND